ncbi:VWA domain-containing protein [Terracidiphilus gabretensis]|uniref:VWA domain-containing protein n=1 Tax=Terracidiphilus gabretensis TaxID=1577687 RepID=UPI0009E6F8BB|nr:VWA domain-containing protein [Terracidiphilus gabretensis]
MIVKFPDSAPARHRLVRAAACAVLAVSAFLSLAAQQTAPPTPPAQQQPPAQPPAQNQAPAPSDADQVLRVGVNEVSLIFTVTDRHGRYVSNLQQSDFALLDDQKAPAKVTSFRQQTNLPMRVGIVIDASTSIRTRFQFEQQSAVEFLLSTLKPQNDKAFVMGFDVTPNITQDWTNNLDGLETGINRLRPGGGTAMFDAVYTACRDKLLSQRGVEPVRKAMILITDGDDNQSRVHEDEAIKMCQRAETIIYAISTNWTPSRGRGDKVLADMATATGGQVFFPPSVEEMSASFKDIQAELRSQYLLTYTPADFKLDGAFRTIYLYCNDRRYQVRAKKGYFATP